MSEHAKQLEPKVRQFQERLGKMGTLGDDLLNIMHRPGWTTLIDVQFVALSLDSLNYQLEGVERAYKALNGIADQIGQRSERAAGD